MESDPMNMTRDDESDGGAWLPAPETECARLIALVLSDMATSEDERRLSTRIEEPEARRAYLAHLQVNAELQWRWRRPQFGLTKSSDDGPGVSVIPANAQARSHRVPSGRAKPAAPWWALAAGVVIAFGTAVISGLPFSMFKGVSPMVDESAVPAAAAVVGEVLDTHNIAVERPMPLPEPHQQILSGDRFEVTRGLLEIRLTGGAELIVHGPASFVVLNSSTVFLDRGRLVARFSAGDEQGDDGSTGHGFRVETSSATFTDLGTEFAVEVADDETASLYVYEGTVDVAAKAIGMKAERVTAGDGRRVSRQGSMTPTPGPAPAYLVRSMPGAAAGGSGGGAGVRKEVSPTSIGGIYPRLTCANQEGECGIGAVVPWADRLWVITYAPHKPAGSSDKLYEITPDLQQRIFPGSVGGTPANRLIHSESNQLFIGPYCIDAQGTVRTIPPTAMYGRLTGTARHLFEPAGKVYFATMEEGLYEVDVDTLAVSCLIRDGNAQAPPQGVVSKLPGYHGKGLSAGQQRLVYANNGEQHPDVSRDPTIPSGALAEWRGSGDWQLVRRNQFTEVTGPGGIRGSTDPDSPIWTLGWDARSVILGLLEAGQWQFYRLPKGSHSYDGSHGWNTEWPRIREIGEADLLATMHGTFWRFPAGFTRHTSGGIEPRSNYLKVVGDFCRWQDRIVLGCDDSAKSEFMNTRPFKAKHAGPGQSNSNLWFIEPKRLDRLGPALGRGSVWLREDLPAGAVSEPFLFSGYDHRQLAITHASADPVTVVLEVDRNGNDTWEALAEVTVPAAGTLFRHFPATEAAVWIRLRAVDAAQQVTAHFHYRDPDQRPPANGSLFSGIAAAADYPARYGLMRSLSAETLGVVAATKADGSDASYYELNQSLQLVPRDDPAAAARLVKDVAQPADSFIVDDASVVLVEDGRRYRLPTSAALRPYAEAKVPKLTVEDAIRQHLARGAAMTASSTYRGAQDRADHAVDGLLGDAHRWVSRADREGSHITIDLGAPTSFQCIWVITGWQQGTAAIAQEFEVQVEENGHWETLPGAAIRGNREHVREIVLDASVNAQRLRVVTASSDHFRVYEVAVFAERPAVEDVGDPTGYGRARVCREVATERDLLNVAGTFYELPARNAGGVAKLRPICTHDLAIHDFCSHNGLLLVTGLDADTASDRIIRSADGKAAVWAGVVDELWQLGKPRGEGGPWRRTRVQAGVPSDPYLMTGYDRKRVAIGANGDTTIALEVDIDGTGLWVSYQSFGVAAGQTVRHTFPDGFSAYWVRSVSSHDTEASVIFEYD